LPWRQSSTMPGWVWQGDTSSDEVTGHMFAYTLYHQLVAQTPSEKMRAARLLTNCMAYVVKNNFYLVDVTGQRTTWGVWNPSFLNDNPDWFDQRGVNSLQIVSWLSSAQLLAKSNGISSSIFQEAMDTLVNQYEYELNVINTKIPVPNDNNFSDDELTFLPYYTYLLGQGQMLKEEFYIGIDRAFDIVKTYKSPLWAFIYGASLQKRSNSPFNTPPTMASTDVQNAIQTLKVWPLSWINWPTDNTQRKDILISQYLNRADKTELITLLPYDEINFFRWNTDPYQLEKSGNGFNLEEPTAFLLPYWMGRYHGIISPPISK
jgi:hypothetical protein